MFPVGALLPNKEFVFCWTAGGLDSVEALFYASLAGFDKALLGATGPNEVVTDCGGFYYFALLLSTLKPRLESAFD